MEALQLRLHETLSAAARLPEELAVALGEVLGGYLRASTVSGSDREASASAAHQDMQPISVCLLTILSIVGS